jgi:hypothetical protein
MPTKKKKNWTIGIQLINNFSLLTISGDMYNIVPSAVIVPPLSHPEKFRDSPKSPINYYKKY